MKFNTIKDAIADFKKGKFVIVVDDENRENEGDFIIAAENITPEAVNFMTIQARGLMCVGLTEKRAKELHLDLMVSDNTAIHNTRFTVSVDYTKGTTTGISAFDRAATIKALADSNTNPMIWVVPDIFFRLWPAPEVFCVVPDIPRHLSIWR